MGMDHVYDWRLTEPGEQLLVHIARTRDADGQSRVRRHARRCDRRELSPARLRGRSLRYPFLTARILARIYGHALRLRLRGASYFPHPHKGSAAGMSSTIRPLQENARTLATPARAHRRAGALARPRWPARLVLRLLARIRGGELELRRGRRAPHASASRRPSARCGSSCRGALAALLPRAAARQHRPLRVLHGRPVGVR